MHASLSSAMVTLCLTDYLDALADARVHVHNLGGNIPYEIERLGHCCLLDTPHEELPSKRFARSKVYVDCNSLGQYAIEAAHRLYGPDRIVFGTDGTEFGCEWSSKAVADAAIDARTRVRIAAMVSSTVLIAPVVSTPMKRIPIVSPAAPLIGAYFVM